MRIPVCIPVIPRKAKEYVNAVIDKNWVSSLCLDEDVNFLKKLEEGFSSFIGVRYGIAVTSGTTALDLAVATLDLGPGDEVIVPSFTMIASVTPIIRGGARPVFVDADETTWCMDARAVKKAVTEKTKAIMAVHIYGYPVDMDAIMQIAQEHNLSVIEDAAEAIGTQYKGRMVGGIGTIGCFSFYANKMMTCGEGGLLVTDQEEHARRAAKLKDQAFGEPRFIHDDIGFNFRMNNLTAAYAYASFEEVSDSIEKRIKNAALYDAVLSDIEGIVRPPRGDNGCRNSYWMYGVLVDPARYGRTKSELRGLLKSEHGVDTRDFFFPMHKQPIMIQKGYVSEEARMPVSEKLWDQGFYLPSSTDLTEEQINYVGDALRTLAT
jgi:perosamine synthetase